MRTRLTFLYFLAAAVLIIGSYVTASLYFREPEPLAFEDEIYEYDDVQEMVTVSVPVETEAPVTSNARICIPQIKLNVPELQSANKNFQGWLLIPDSPISYPVVSTDDNNYYLTHSFTGYETAYGCLFFDVYSTTGTRNRVIHGHNMGAGHEKMFSSLLRYQDQSYAEAHSLVCFADLDGITDGYRVFAVVNFDTDNLDAFNYRKADFEKEEEYQAFVTYLQSQSIYKTEFKPDGSDLLILSTCNREYGSSNRLLVCTVKILAGEVDRQDANPLLAYIN